MIEQIIHGPLLIPLTNGGVAFFADGALAVDGKGIIEFAGDRRKLGSTLAPTRKSDGVILPPLLDVHTHIPQHPIRGRFAEGVADDEPGGKLLGALRRNVFPAETKCGQSEYAAKVIEAFAADVLASGVVGGATYMTVSAGATEMALEILPETWSVGLVMMNQNCPRTLRTDEKNLAEDIARMARRFGRRLIVTDRFAVATDTSLRRAGSGLAREFGLRTQTHLNEQMGEKNFVEKELYPQAKSYTDVYLKDGLLEHQCILAHCIHMTPVEWDLLVEAGGAVAHCPTSNLKLGSGLMRLDDVLNHGIEYAIATDVGASPTVSMLAEMKRFLDMQEGNSKAATPTEALWRATLAPARILGLEGALGRLESGRPASFIEVQADGNGDGSVDCVIRSLLPVDADEPRAAVSRVTMKGKVMFERNDRHA
jgi:guanine deaminase